MNNSAVDAMAGKENGASALLARFAFENGLDLRALEGEDVRSLRLDAYRILSGSEPRTSEPLLSQISALRIERPMRFGNSVVQLSNAIELASRHGIRRIDAPGFWWITTAPEVDRGEITVSTLAAPAEEIILSGHYYYREFLGSLYLSEGKSIEGFRRNLLRVRSQISLLEACPPLPDDHLVIHIRSGDIFEGRGHPLYGQPPLAFYTLVLRKGPWRRVTLVSEDRSNPVVDRLLEFSGSGLPPVDYRQASLEEDLRFLLRARSLVSSLGTFIPAVLALSGHVRRVICFGGLWYANTLLDRLDVVVVQDRSGHYRRSVLSANWCNDESQLALMLDYPESALRLVQLPRRPAPVDASRPESKT